MLKLTGLPSENNQDSIKTAFGDSSLYIAFVDISQDNSAYVLLRGGIDAKAVLAKLEETGKVTVGDTLVDVAVPDGEEEDAYLKKAQEYLNNKATNFKENRGGDRVQKRAKTRGGVNRGSMLNLTGLPSATVRDPIKKSFGDSSANVSYVSPDDEISDHVYLHDVIQVVYAQPGDDLDTLLKESGETLEAVVIPGEDEEAAEFEKANETLKY